MKSITITLSKELLEELDATEEVRREGRDAVLHRAVSEYLGRRESRAIAEAYRRAYGTDSGLGNEFISWEEQGRWPEA